MQLKFISVKYSAYGVGSYESHSPYFPYADILNLTVEKIPYNIEAAAAEVVGSNPINPFLLFWENRH